jgi:hypothetical protein
MRVTFKRNWTMTDISGSRSFLTGKSYDITEDEAVELIEIGVADPCKEPKAKGAK